MKKQKLEISQMNAKKIRELRQELRKQEQELWESELSKLGLIYRDNFRKYIEEGMDIEKVCKLTDCEKNKMPTFPSFITEIVGQPKSFETTIEPGSFDIKIFFSHKESNNFSDYLYNSWQISIKADTKDGQKWGYGYGKYTPREYADRLEIVFEKNERGKIFKVATISKLTPNTGKESKINTNWVDNISTFEECSFQEEYEKVKMPNFLNYWKDTFSEIVF